MISYEGSSPGEKSGDFLRDLRVALVAAQVRGRSSRPLCRAWPGEERGRWQSECGRGWRLRRR